jgi:hypothetical protein
VSFNAATRSSLVSEMTRAWITSANAGVAAIRLNESYATYLLVPFWPA